MSASTVIWKTRIFNSETLKNKLTSESSKDHHPLKNVVITERMSRRIIIGSVPSTGRSTPLLTSISSPSNNGDADSVETILNQKLDPLSSAGFRDNIEELDPLTRMAVEKDLVDHVQPKISGTETNRSDSQLVDPIRSWSTRKTAILQKFTTSEKLSMITSFLSEGETVVIKTQNTAVDKVQHRLEQLDAFEEGSQRKLNLSQTEYIVRIEQLNKELILAWNIEQRVKALKIAIQCAKMLADTDVLPFYPSKFVLITNILDCFGNLVYERLKGKCDINTGTSSSIDSAEAVSDIAKETCYNWFFKIASIRELVPRLYIEMALLKSYKFISIKNFNESLLRLTKMIQGIGNPLVAIYARCHLCRIGLPLITNQQNGQKNYEFLKKNLENFLESYQHSFSRSVDGQMHKQNISVSTYISLYTPAVDYIMHCVVYYYQPDRILDDLLVKCKLYSNSSLILNTIMSGFKPLLISERSLQFLSMIGQSADEGVPLSVLLHTLGQCISVSSPPLEQRKPLLNLVWINVTQLTDLKEYISCIGAWIAFIAQHFSTREVNTILGDLVDRIHSNKNTNNEFFSAELKIIIQKILMYMVDFENLLAMENILPFVNLFHEESTKVDICKLILLATNSSSTEVQKTCDPIIINALMFLGSILHDSVNALTPEDEFRQIGDILCSIIMKIDYGNDFEQQLQFYVDSRALFANLDVVLAELVQCVNRLEINTRKQLKGHYHTRKTADFVRACAAYCFITIPSIESPLVRLKMYLLSGQVALFNSCYGQADACFKAILTTIQTLSLSSSQETELFLLSFIRQCFSVLLIVPDNPEKGVLNLIRLFLNVLRTFEWNHYQYLGLIYINVIDLFSIMAQEIYPYHVEKVESNDFLWGSDPKFIEDINRMISIIIEELLKLLQKLGQSKKQCQIAFDLFIRVAIRSDLTTKETFHLALKLWNLCRKNEYADTKYMAQTKTYLFNESTKLNNVPLKQLSEQLVLS